MKKIGIILANDMDESEIILPLYFWRKLKFQVDLISLEKKNSVVLSNNVKVWCNETITGTNTSQYRVIYIPGGNGASKLTYENWPTKKSEELIKKVIRTLTNIVSEKNKKLKLILTDKSLHVLSSLQIIESKDIVEKINNRLANEDDLFLNIDDLSLFLAKGYHSLPNLILETIDFCLNQGDDHNIDLNEFKKLKILFGLEE